MISMDSLMEMICTEAVEGGDRISCRDYDRNPEPELPLPERYKTYLVKMPSGKSFRVTMRD